LTSAPHLLNASPMPKPVRSAPRCSNDGKSSSPSPCPGSVVDLNQHAIGAGTNSERHRTVRSGELECVLHEIPDHRREDLSIGFNRHFLQHRRDNEREAAGVRL
jgi:hypothetical protein